MMPPMMMAMMLRILTPCAIAEKNNMTPNTDSPNYYAPNAYDDDDASPNYLILYSSLNRKIYPRSIIKLNKIKLQ